MPRFTKSLWFIVLDCMKLIQTVSNDRDQDLSFFKYPHSFFSQLIAGVCPATGDLRLHASRYWLVQCFPFLARCQDDLCTTKIHEPTRPQKFTASKMGLCRWVWKWGMGPWVMISLVFFCLKNWIFWKMGWDGVSRYVLKGNGHHTRSALQSEQNTQQPEHRPIKIRGVGQSLSVWNIKR